MKTGAFFGLLVAAVFFFADLLGASFAVGWLFDPTIDSALLVAVAGVAELFVGAAAGALISLGWPRRWQLGSRSAVALFVGFFVVVALSGYFGRLGRNLTPPVVSPAAKAGRPAPVLMVMIDTLRADTLYGVAPGSSERPTFPLAPQLRDWADNQQVVTLTDAESAAGWTIPSVATLFTGIHPVTLYSARHFLPAWAPTLATRLLNAGYTTHAVVDNALLEPRNGFGQGFESYYQRSGLRFAFSLAGLRLLPTIWRETLREHLRTFYYGAAGVTDQALALLDAQGGKPDKPLFLYVHYMDPHFPYYPHAHLPADPEDAEPVNLAIAMDELAEDPTDVPTTGEVRFLKHRYDNEVRFLDEHLHRLLSAWHARYGDEGLVILTADHGEEFADHGGLGHGNTMYRELVNVPLMLRLPTALPVTGPNILNTPVGQVDVVPTVLHAVQLADDSGVPVQGKSLLPWLQGIGAAPDRPLFATQHRHRRRIYRYREGSAVKLTTYIDGNDTAKQELFDLGADPRELRDEAATKHDIIAAMGRRFEPMMQSMQAQRDPKPVVLESDEEGLRALGYIQ